MIGVLGKSGTGKSALAKVLCSNYGFHEVVLYTTRPMREGEHNHIDYHFIDKEDFLQKKEDGFFVETRQYDTIYGTWYYGSIRADYTDNSVAVLSPEMYLLLKDVPDIDIFSVYLNIDNRSLLSKINGRGDNKKEIRRRLASDTKRLPCSLINEFNLIINNFGYRNAPNTLAEIVMKLYPQ